MRTRALTTLALIAALGACADETQPASLTTVIPLDDGKADGDAEVRVRAEGATLWIDPVLIPRAHEDRTLFVLRARFSRNLTSILSFVPDDPFGAAIQTSARKVEVAFDPSHELSSLVFGMPTLLAFGTGTKQWTARLGYEPSLTGFSGSSALWIDRHVAVVFVAGETVYRVRFETPVDATAVEVAIGDLELAVTTEERGLHHVDLDHEAFVAIASGGNLAFSATLPSGAVRQKTARATVRVAKVDVTLGDPYEVWPQATCLDDVKACLESELSCVDGDTEVCGSAWEVTRCRASVSCPH